MILKVTISFKSKQQSNAQLAAVLLPLILVVAGIVVFYFVDVKQLLADNRMYHSYLRMQGNEKGESHYAAHFWMLFALLGSGFIFEIIFGILGIISLIYGVYRLLARRNTEFTQQDYFKLYALLLLLLTICLIFTGKLLGGVARLTAFTIPSISILIISLLEDIRVKYHYPRPVNKLAFVLFAGLFGNILTTCIHTFTYPEYSNRIETYRNTSQALSQARLDKIPVMITDGVRGDKIADKAPCPGKISFNTITQEQILGADTLCAEVVLKVNPEFKVWDRVPVYFMPDNKWTGEYIKQLPASVTKVMVGDGITFRLVNRYE